MNDRTDLDPALFAELVEALRDAHSRIGVHIPLLEGQGSIVDASKSLHRRMGVVLAKIGGGA